MPTTSCTSAMGATTVTGNLDSGAGCVLNGTTITGAVTVEPGVSLAATNAVIAGSVSSQGATKVSLQGGSVGGDVTVDGGLPCVIVGSNTVGGNVTIENTAGDATTICGGFSGDVVEAGSVAGNVTLSGNSVTSINTSVVAVVVNGANRIGNGVTIVGNTLSAAGFNELAVQGSGETTPAAIAGGLDIEHNSVGVGSASVDGIVVSYFSLNGDAKVTDNSASGAVETDAVLVQSIAVSGNLLFQRNSATGPAGATVGVVVDGSTIGSNLNCAGNAPSPDTLGNANTPKNANGQCESMPNLIG